MTPGVYAGIPVGQASIGLLIFIAFFLVAAVFTGNCCTEHMSPHYCCVVQG